jgi:hypothetical protein
MQEYTVEDAVEYLTTANLSEEDAMLMAMRHFNGRINPRYVEDAIAVVYNIDINQGHSKQ